MALRKSRVIVVLPGFAGDDVVRVPGMSRPRAYDAAMVECDHEVTKYLAVVPFELAHHIVGGAFKLIRIRNFVKVVGSYKRKCTHCLIIHLVVAY